MAFVLALAPVVTGFPQVFSPAHAHPVRSNVHKVGFVKSSVAALRTASNATHSAVGTRGTRDPLTTARAAAVTPVQDVAGAVTVVGVTWPKGAVSAHAQFQIRTLSGGTWSLWQSMGVIDGGPDANAATSTTGTDPYVVAGASRYEVRSLTTEAAVATAATVQAIDPGTSNADNVQQAPGAAAAATVKPVVYTRADWGADESKMTWTPSYGKIQVGFVHHTVDANNYAAGDVPAMIRGIYAYHAQTLGWGDIGYNFLIDRFGRTWEGRDGGMDKPVIGGQAYGYNAVSTGVAGIGNYDIAPAPQAMTDAFKKILAWKLSLAGIPATGASTVLAPNGTPLQRVSGHRDGYPTACPGQYLYAKLAEIRAGAAAIMSAPTVAVTTPGGFTSLAPARLLDTRTGVGSAKIAVAARATVHLQVSGRGGVPASGVSAVVLNVTVAAPTNPGFVTVSGDGTIRPDVSNLNFVKAQTVPNLVIAPVGTNGKVALYNGSAGTIQLIADVSGYYLSVTPSVPGAFGSLVPSRLLDTRSGAGAGQVAVAAGATVHLQVSGRGGVPASGVSAVVLNVTVTDPTNPGFVTVSGDGTARPDVSNLNFVKAQTVPNLVIAPIGTNGKVALYNGSAGTIQLIADVSGYYLSGAPSVPGAFGSLVPSRLLDTRSGVGAAKIYVAAGATVHLQVAGRGGIPASSVSAVVLNVTVITPTSAGFMTVFGDGTTRPGVSNLNFVRTQTVPNLVIAAVGTNGKVALFNGSAGSIQLIADVSGWFKNPY
jgi:hypothetical protein